MATDEMASGERPFPHGRGRIQLQTSRGHDVVIRHMASDDTDRLVDFYHRLSPQTRYFRFFRPTEHLPEEYIRRYAAELSTIDPLTQAALVATVQEQGDEQIIGVARLAQEGDDPAVAEMAIVVRDDFQGQRIGSALADLLMQVAMVRGIKTMRAYALFENEAIRRLIRSIGLRYTIQTSMGETTLQIELLS